MSEEDYKKLLYRKQFLLTSRDIEGLYSWKRHEICNGEKKLYVHPDLDCTVIEQGHRRLVFLGYIFDWQNPEYGNDKILGRIFEENEYFDDLLRATFEYSGRFAAIYEDEDICSMFHDAGGQREVYYHVGENGVSCASQLPIMEKFLEVEQTDNEQALALYGSDAFIRSKKQWVGEETIYKGVKALRPNFYLDISGGKAVRYWPKEPLEGRSLEWASEKGARMLKGFLKAANMRNNIMMPVTAGWDSRMLLAASRDISDEVKYFIIKFPWMDKSHEDIAVPKRLMSRLGKSFEIVESGENVDEGFQDVFCQNTAYCRTENLVGIYNVFYKKYPEYMSISSHVSEVIRNYRGSIKSPNGKAFSIEVGYKEGNDYAEKMCQAWIDKNIQFTREMNIDPFVLFYWEEGLIWEASHRTETDIAIEEYCPFSCRTLLEMFASVDHSYRNKYTCPLYKRIMEKLWPHVVSEPINPSFKNTVKGILVSMDWFYMVKRFMRKL